MKKFNSVFKKTWVFAIAIALIVGSSSVMSLTLGLKASATPNSIPVTDTAKTGIIANDSNAITNENVEGLIVIDRSNPTPAEISDFRERVLFKLNLSKMSNDEIQTNLNKIVAQYVESNTLGEKDITAEQAAAYASAIITKAYGIDLKGYTADASFYRSSVPNSSGWSVNFLTPGKTNTNDIEGNMVAYASVNSVNGTMINAGLAERELQISKNLKDPAWKEKAELSVSKLLTGNVSITKSKVVSAAADTGVTVVCELSDGSAYSVRLTGDNMETNAFLFFPNGYDGSLDSNRKLDPNAKG